MPMNSYLLALSIVLAATGAKAGADKGGKPWTSASYRASDMPRVYMTYAQSKDFEGDVKDMRKHGVDAIEWEVTGSKEKEQLKILRRYGMKAVVWGGEVSRDPAGIERLTGEKAVRARCIGGSYRGLDIGRHLFAFTAGPQTIIVEPPRQNAKAYWSGFVPVKAEAVVPLKAFDGEQHLKIIPATFHEASPGAVPEKDTAGDDEGQKSRRRLYEIGFDLTGLEDALLDKVGIAVYWENGGNASVFAESTAVAWERYIENRVKYWRDVGGGTFPRDVIKAMRVGDETFNWTARLDSPAESMPFWDFSAPAVAAYERRTGGRWNYPRTVGCPEIYGEEACGAWLYNWHRACAVLVARAVRKVHSLLPGMLCMRNTTRGWTCCWENDWDGTGQELLMRALDAGFLDPYPVLTGGKYFNALIPMDTEYIAGLARRYGNKPLIPWTQAHKFPGMDHPAPEQIDRILTQHWDIGFDAIFWFGYTRRVGKVFGACELTFPLCNSASWERAAEWHGKIAKRLPPKPVADIAVLRPYTKRAICIPAWDGENGIRHPADRKLQQAIWDIAAKGGHYDVFEVPPLCCESDEVRAARAEKLKKYKRIIRTEDFE